MLIRSISRYPIHQISFVTAGNQPSIVQQILPILLAKVDALPPGLEAIIATSDLQGIDPNSGRLLGHLVAEDLEKLAEIGILPPPQQTGIILAGDLYAKLNKRGGVGDVRSVWQAFNQRFRWVAGVGGNHDSFGRTQEDIQEFSQQIGINYLDGQIIEIDKLRIAGISGIIGNPNKAFRRLEKDFIKSIRALVQELPDILIMHEGPSHPEVKLAGNDAIRKELMAAHNLLVVCGHSHWKVPITAVSKGVQVLNVDSRVVVLKAS